MTEEKNQQQQQKVKDYIQNTLTCIHEKTNRIESDSDFLFSLPLNIQELLMEQLDNAWLALTSVCSKIKHEQYKNQTS